MKRSHYVISAGVAAGLAGLTLAAKAAFPAAGEIELEEAKVLIEWNSTASDFGIHFSWDGPAWRSMSVENERGQEALSIRTKRNLRSQGLTEGFFESAEPPTSELSLAQFRARFPEGTWQFQGETLDGHRLVGDADFSHTLPAPPAGLSPAAGDVVSRLGFTITFDPVTQDIDGHAIQVAYYEVEVEKIVDEPIVQRLDLILRPAVTSVGVPAAFLEPGTEYKYEVIAVLDGGNSTITESGTFTTD